MNTALNKFFASFLILTLALACQTQCRDLFGWVPDLVLASLLVFIFYLNFFELAFLASVAALFLNWRQAPNIEISLLILLPLLAFAAMRFIPWHKETTGFAVSITGIAIFYAVTNFSGSIANMALVLEAGISAILFAGIIFYTFRFIYKFS
jgi:hypothetical protein